MSAAEAAEAEAVAAAGGDRAGSVDPLDQFMAGNATARQTERRAEAAAALAETERALAEVDGMLSFAQPAYLSLGASALAQTAGVADPAAIGKRPKEEPTATDAAAVAAVPPAKRAMTVAAKPAPGSLAATIAAARASNDLQGGSGGGSAESASAAVAAAAWRAANAAAKAKAQAETAARSGGSKGDGDAGHSSRSSSSSGEAAAAAAAEEHKPAMATAHTGAGGLGTGAAKPAATKRGESDSN